MRRKKKRGEGGGRKGGGGGGRKRGGGGGRKRGGRGGGKRGRGGSLDCYIVYRLDNQGISVPFLAQERHFFLLKTSRLYPRPKLLLLQWIMGAISLRTKWPGHKAVHLLQSTTEVKNV